MNDNDTLVDYLPQKNTQVISVDNACSFKEIRIKDAGTYTLKIIFTLGDLEIIETLKPFFISERSELATLTSSNKSLDIGSNNSEINQKPLRRLLADTFQNATANISVSSISTYFNANISINLTSSNGAAYANSTVFMISDNETSITVSPTSNTTITGGSKWILVYFNSSGVKNITITIPSLNYTIAPLSITVVNSILNVSILSTVIFI